MRRACRVLAAASALLASVSASPGAARADGSAGGGDDAAAQSPWLTESDNGTSPAEEAPGALPSVHWKTLFTPHFRIHFYDDERGVADRAAQIAERAHGKLTRYLNWLPSGRIDLTLNDQTDAANGFASSVPQNFLYGYAAPPSSVDELNDFDDFLNVLITHELTHVIHLDTIMGPARAVNVLKGKVYAPNLSQPTWFIEGLAVLMESRQTSAGRVRSAFFDMELRCALLEGRFLNLDAVSNGPLAFPQGTAVYLYGANLLRFIEDRYGPDKLQEISHRYGSRLLPGGINRVAREALGRGYDQIWTDWKDSLGRRVSLEVEDAERRGLTPATRLTRDGQGPRDGLFPRYFRDGRGVVYAKATNVEHPAYVLLDPATGTRRELMESYGSSAAAPTPDGRALIIQRTNFLALPRRVSGSSHASWDDLFRVDLASGEIRELTRGQRAHEPDVSPDGRRIACTVGTTGRRDLAVVPIEGGRPAVLAPDAPGLAYTPAWSPDGRQIAYSRWKPGGMRDIHVYDLASGQDRALMTDRAIDLDPRFSPDGRFVLFSSDRTGIYNIFAFELATSRLYQVTNLVSGAFQPTVAPDGSRLVFTGFSSDGFDLFTAPFAPASWPLAQPYANARPDAPAAVVDRGGAGGEEITEYHPWRYIHPRTWELSVPSNPLGLGASLGLVTGASDPVGNHSIALNLLVPSTIGDTSARVDYTYSGLWPLLQLSASRTAVLAYDLIIDDHYTSYRQHQGSVSAGTTLPILVKTDSSANLAFTYVYSQYGPADRVPVADPTAGITVPPETGPDARLFVNLAYSNVHAWGYSISGQTGRSLQLSLGFADPAIGGKFHTAEATWSWTEYLTPPWAKLHALAMLYSGGIGVGDKPSFFSLGGFVQQDVIRSLFLNRPQCCFFLRGYAPNSIAGDQFHLLSAEYRLPLLWVERGYETFPFYVRRLSGALFSDVGNAFVGDFHPRELKVGVGAQIQVELKLAYYIETQLQLGVAKGLSAGGANQYYFVTAFPIF
jgi:Tol biopolymer transport system component